MIAKKLFKCRIDKALAEDEFSNLLEELGVPDTWGHFTYDDYDSSFELSECNLDLKFTPEQLQRFWSEGFERCWIGYNDGSEWFYSQCGSPEGTQTRKPRWPDRSTL